jgi:hypothetical protein
MFGGQFTNANALASLLTVESLLFAALSLATSLSTPGTRVRDLPLPAPVLGLLAASFLTIVAFGAAMAWWSIFVVDWPRDFRGNAVAIALATAIVGQPAFAWAAARGLRARR